MLVENLRIALRAIASNLLRSVLTVLGVMIGVAAVIAVVSVIQGLQRNIAEDLRGIGSTAIEVYPSPNEDEGSLEQPLTLADAFAVRRAASFITGFTPLYMVPAVVEHGDTRRQVRLYAVGTAYQAIFNRWVEHGRFFTELDEEQKKHVCVLGLDAARELGLRAPLTGKTVRIEGTTFTVVGLLEKRGGTLGNQEDDVILIPFATVVPLAGSDALQSQALAFQFEAGTDLQLVKERVTTVLRVRHRLPAGTRNDFRIVAREDAAKMVSSVLMNVTMITGAVVGIALLVGGIGIMNVMLVSVTERTREIGVRKSIGARRKDIMIQFVIEAVTLSSLGGAIGILAGFLLANAARLVITRWVEIPPVHTPLWAILTACGFCAFLGVLFGIYPAARASKLDPIEALRYE